MVELGQYEKILSIPANEIQVPFLIALFTALKGNDYLAGLTYPLSEGSKIIILIIKIKYAN
jgi:hypothetical protein